MSSPLVYVVLVNWNGLTHLQACLPTLARTAYRPFQVLVVDNGSTDGSEAWARAHFPAVRWLSLGRNEGFARGNNRGIEQALAAGAAYVVLLNNDTRVEADWLPALVESAETHPQAAICQARQRTWDGEQEIRFRFMPAWAEADAHYTPITPPGPPRPTPFASGCAMLLRAAALPALGLFDERYFMYVEDVDLTLRAWILGYDVLDVPAAVVYHRFGGSAGDAPRRMVWGYRNQLTTLLKLYQPATLRQFWPPIRARWFFTRNRYALRGTLAALAWLPGTLARRRAVQCKRAAPDSRFLQYVVR
ncbi:MAG: glycosyltransferase family 2 protein [Anaerolineales bacterium]|nr:glycosyltransferase family 2 protein [Anaerolineales bacterium]MCB8950864.1 glycosyltransferase family 2 protein [Ardenticatenales bacterium]